MKIIMAVEGCHIWFFCRYSLTHLKYLLLFVVAPYVQSLCVYVFGDLRYAKDVAADSVPG